VLRILQADGLAVERESALTEVDVDAFFKRSLIPKSWHTTEDKAQLAQLQQLKVLLTESLQHLRVYRYGEVDISVYILGVTPEGKIAGVKTRLVET
ncbi:MAG: nuclease A inhibitor family protein, partial [Cyanobacteria bacterium J06560_2]